MSIRVSIRHRTEYRYDRPILLSPQLVRLRPAAHCRTPIHAYSLQVEPRKHFVNWQQDPFGNFVARYVFPERVKRLVVEVELIAGMTVINPFDFFVEEYAEHFPFRYPEHLAGELTPYLKLSEEGPLLREYVAAIDRRATPIVDFLVAANQRIQGEIGYTVRMEPGVQSCERTLGKRTGSCRDSAWLLVQVLRRLGLAARFVSGYLVQLAADEAALDGPSGPARDFTDLHAWAEVYVPGAGWIGLDPTSGLFAGEGHIPLACTPEPTSAAPLSGLMEPCETEFAFDNRVVRIHEQPRVTLPYSDAQWGEVMALGDRVERVLEREDVRLTQGGEPTFVSIDDRDGAEWNSAAMGPRKERLGRQLLGRLAGRFAPHGVLHHGQGKWYPGEELPRWAYGCFFRADGEPLWRRRERLSPPEAPGYGTADAARLADELARRLGVAEGTVMAAYEDAAHYLRYEASLPDDVDPHTAELSDPLERRRLARLLGDGLDRVTGYALPLAWSGEGEEGGWFSVRWSLRRERLVLLPGDSPMGYRLPLDSLPWAARRRRLTPERDGFEARDPLISASEIASRYSTLESAAVEGGLRGQPSADDEGVAERIPHTALCVEPREGRLWVFLPPLTHLEHWIGLLAVVEAAADACGLAVELEGYEPPADPRLSRLAVTPDPGVIEVNIHPAANWRELVTNIETLYGEARESRLGTEKFMLDGRHTGTGGGNHVTLGGATPADSPFLRRPDLLASLLLHWQHHPALSYLFSGLFVGPTSQAPRVDEARDDALYELEIALQQLVPGEACAPWKVDRLFRNLLVDLTGNTHRAEFCIDKLYSPSGPAGRLGLVEFRGFEMPPHWRMSAVQMLLTRALVARFWRAPYRGRPARWGTALHDRFLLAHYLEEDLRQVLDELGEAGFEFRPEWFAPFFEFRFPHYGEVHHHGVSLELRGAIEPWNVLGEEVTSQGTARFVDSSLERLQVKVRRFNPQRYCVTCNGRRVPLQSTGVEGEFVAGVRFKAWQPAFGLHPLLPADGPLVFDLFDLNNRRSIGGCTYHVAHPGGRHYETLPINANEAEARRVARFQPHGHRIDAPFPPEESPNPAFPVTLDLRYGSALNEAARDLRSNRPDTPRR